MRRLKRRQRSETPRRRKKQINGDGEEATAAFLINRGHTLEYFFSLKPSAKLFCHAAMELQQKQDADKLKLLAERTVVL